MTYAQMKRKAAQHQNDLNGYCDHKSEFITSMTENRKLPAMSLKSRTKAAEHLLERRMGITAFLCFLPARSGWVQRAVSPLVGQRLNLGFGGTRPVVAHNCKS